VGQYHRRDGLIRRVEGAARSLTLPLIEKADGRSSGRRGRTVWLDAAKTSPYEMYQFWLNTSDADVVGFLSISRSSGATRSTT